MSLGDELAQELVDIILDFLHEDHTTLLSASLTARKWVPATRYHVFERITLNHFLAPRPNRFIDNAHEFLDIAASPHCSILPGIQNVVLNVDVGRAFDGLLMLKCIINVLGGAPISKILFVDHTTSYQQPLSLSWITPHFPGLREFSYNALGRFVEDTFTLTAPFTELRTLSLYSTSKDVCTTAITQAKPYPTLPEPIFAHLHTLRLRLFSHQADEFLAWLQTTGADHPRLETLDFNVYHPYHNGWGPVDALNAFLASPTAAAHLRDLCIRVRYDEQDADEDQLVVKESDGDVDLSALTSLRSLTLNAHNGEDICNVLLTAPPALEALDVSFKEWIHYFEFPCECNPGVLVHEFASIMDGAQFDRLARFVIRVPEFFGDEGVEALRTYFPRWEGTDVVSIGFIERTLTLPDSWESVSEGVLGRARG